MKNFINYYYNLIVGEFKKNSNRFLFEINNQKYEFNLFELDIKEFEKIYYLLINSRINFYEIVFNKDGSMITIFNGKPYILLRKNNYIEKNIHLNDIMNYDIFVYKAKNINWKSLWINKLDYYEYQMSQLSFKYKDLSESFSYYIGMSETAVNLLNYLESEYIDFYISHRRINCFETTDDLMNPLNIIFDSRTRDIGEYIKQKYINEFTSLNDIYEYLNSLDLNYNECILLLARFLYPSYYLDLYDQIVQSKISEEKINIYTKKNVYYETFLKKTYKYFRNKHNNFPEIEWLQD